MRVGEVKQASLGPVAATGGEAAAAASQSRALVALAPAAPMHAIATVYRQAPFLAHLLAVKGQHAQTRERRRAAPQEAIAAYRASAGLAR